MHKIEEFESRTGDETLKVEGYLLHSKYDPKKEASRVAKDAYAPHNIHIIFGYGKGYIVDALQTELKYDEPIVIIDPLVENKELAIDSRHARMPFYYWGPSDVNTLSYVLEQIAPVVDSKVKIIISPNYNKIFPTELKDLLAYVRDSQEQRIVNDNTLIFFAEKWQKNLTENFINVLRDKNLKSLEKYYEKPIIVASGGPSLTKQLKLLKDIQDYVIIVAAGSTINSLLAVEIKPDFVVSMDGGEPNYNHFKGLKLSETKLVYSTFNHPKIRSVFDEAYVFMANGHQDVVQYFRKYHRDFPIIKGGGTVAHFSLEIAKYITNKPIAIIGQDLAYTNNQTHADNNKHNVKIDIKNDNNLRKAVGYNGDLVYTSKLLYSMKTTFEELARFSPHSAPVINCTEGGIKLEGYDQLSFEAFCSKYVSKNIQKVKELPNDFIEDMSRLTDLEILILLEDELKTYDKINLLLTDAIFTLRKNKSKNEFSWKNLKKLENVDNKLSKLTSGVHMDFLMTPIVIEVTNLYLEKPNETQKEKYKRSYDQSYALYTKMIDVVIKAKNNTKDLILKIKKDGVYNDTKEK